MSVLVLAEHDNGSLKDATLNAVTAAKALAGFAVERHQLPVGNHNSKAMPTARRYTANAVKRWLWI